MATDVPRVLRLTYEIRVPPGLRTNIRATQLDKAVDRITGSVQGTVEAVFPWADGISARAEWSYVWRDDSEELRLAKTEQNTVAEPTDGEERDGE
jgi:hypothetical protein